MSHALRAENSQQSQCGTIWELDQLLSTRIFGCGDDLGDVGGYHDLIRHLRSHVGRIVRLHAPRSAVLGKPFLQRKPRRDGIPHRIPHDGKEPSQLEKKTKVHQSPRIVVVRGANL